MTKKPYLCKGKGSTSLPPPHNYGISITQAATHAKDKRTALIIGAGPAGLTAALELLRHTDIHPVILEASRQVGGLSRTVEHNGNRIDIGGHRFFSKDPAVMKWWTDLLYNMFFKHYTEKVWGLPPSKLDASWGRQRVNGISISTLLKNFTRQKAHPRNDIRQEGVEKSLISNFLYPKLGPGQLWEEAAREIIRKGGEIILGHRACRLNLQDGKVREITATTPEGGTRTFTGDYVMSSMPIKDLVAAFGEDVTPGRVRDTASALPYRDFITAGLLLRTPGLQAMPKIPDTWIYIQERDMHVGRIQIFNNWSPYLIHDRHNHLWMGLEYFCNEGDALWRLSDQDFITMAQQELRRTGIPGGMADVEDATVIRERKAYPAYHGSYAELPEVTGWLDGIPNLFCIGRNGQHRYNNMDHSMLTAMEAVSNLRDGRTDKQNIWNVNTEQTYHESQTD